jgi:hypothetical protein
MEAPVHEAKDCKATTLALFKLLERKNRKGGI